jgi:hypothetical protein
VNETGVLLYGYYDENGVAVIVGTDPNTTGPDGEPLTELSADENNEPLTLTQMLEEFISEEGEKVPLMCQ